MAKREAKIAIMLRDGAIAVKSQIKNLSQGDLALLITHIDMLKEDLKELFKKGVKQIKE
jgi:hypothetical protein